VPKRGNPWAAWGDSPLTEFWPFDNPRVVTIPLGHSGTVDQRTPRFRAELSEDFRVSSVEVRDPGGLTAMALQRFPWARWLTAAKTSVRKERAAARAGRPGGSAVDAQVQRVVQAAASGKRVRPPVISRKRPGRAGHPDSVYLDVAKRYAQLCEEGDPHPRKTLATQMHYSPNTMAGLLRKARERGFLGPPRGGPK